jgi:hypothetical protein
VRIEGGEGEEVNKRSGSAICNRSVVEPAVTESAVKWPGNLTRPGMKSIAADPFVAPVRLADEISAASCRPSKSKTLSKYDVQYTYKCSRTCSMLVLQPGGVSAMANFVYRHCFGEQRRKRDRITQNLSTTLKDTAINKYAGHGSS